jgi:hypothetical protein
VRMIKDDAAPGCEQVVALASSVRQKAACASGTSSISG